VTGTPAAWWIDSSVSSRGFKFFRSSALAPSDFACAGLSWTSRKMPSIPAATAARDSKGMNSGWPPETPLAPDGICTEWVPSKTTGAKPRMMASERMSTTRLL
jgi:hypothetical protein